MIIARRHWMVPLVLVGGLIAAMLFPTFVGAEDAPATVAPCFVAVGHAPACTSTTATSLADAAMFAANLVGPPAYLTAQCQQALGLNVQPAPICIASMDAALNNVGKSAGKSLGQTISGG